ncbi:hypothetical protein Z949_2689 [Sulfitobacter guttiformis KCTC 32187]|nr:hypothetical protein Z949_2689 [Sulfitobacter guttiformis KCTC 32187]
MGVALIAFQGGHLTDFCGPSFAEPVMQVGTLGRTFLGNENVWISLGV